MWGILVCTIIGPIGVGIIVGRIEEVAVVAGSRKEVLGGCRRLMFHMPLTKQAGEVLLRRADKVIFKPRNSFGAYGFVFMVAGPYVR